MSKQELFPRFTQGYEEHAKKQCVIESIPKALQIIAQEISKQFQTLLNAKRFDNTWEFSAEFQLGHRGPDGLIAYDLVLQRDTLRVSVCRVSYKESTGYPVVVEIPQDFSGGMICENRLQLAGAIAERLKYADAVRAIDSIMPK